MKSSSNRIEGSRIGYLSVKSENKHSNNRSKSPRAPDVSNIRERVENISLPPLPSPPLLDPPRFSVVSEPRKIIHRVIPRVAPRRRA